MKSFKRFSAVGKESKVMSKTLKKPFKKPFNVTLKEDLYYKKILTIKREKIPMTRSIPDEDDAQNTERVFQNPFNATFKKGSLL